MERVEARLEPQFFDILGRIEAVYNIKNRSDTLRLAIIALAEANKGKINIDDSFIRWKKLDLTRENSRREKEVNFSFGNLKNRILKYALNGQTPRRIWKVISDEKKRMKLCFSKEEKKEIDKWNLEMVGGFCLMVQRAREQNVAVKDILGTGFDLLWQNSLKNRQISIKGGAKNEN